MRSRILTVIPLALLLSSCGKTKTEVAARPPEPPVEEAIALPEKVSFNEHIQPILSEYCYHCHGPDAKTREPKKSPLRLDLEKEAFVSRADGRPVIIKGKPAESQLMKLIQSPDPDMIMPPPKSHGWIRAAERQMKSRRKISGIT